MSRYLRFLLVGLLAAAVSTFALDRNSEVPRESVVLETSDGVIIYGDWFAVPNARATILLFHQGGSNARAEYGPIIPRLLAQDFSVLAIDQRVGGQIYGQYNRTVAEDPSETSYCAVAPDLKAAAEFAKARRPQDPLVLWGSSYSAALALRFAATSQDEFAGVLAFSPASGGPMVECRGDPLFPELEIPILVLRPASEAEMESVATQLDAAREHGHTVYVAAAGVHGSSMLVEQRVGEDVSKNWRSVKAFLDSLVK